MKFRFEIVYKDDFGREIKAPLPLQTTLGDIDVEMTKLENQGYNPEIRSAPEE